MPKVYITNRGCHAFSAATEFGELIYLTTGKFNLTSLGAMYRHMAPILATSTPEDYILVCGPTVMNMVATSIFTGLHNRLNLLLYSVGKDNIGRYKRRHLTLATIYSNCDEETTL